MTITVRFFASLRESIGCREVEIDAVQAGAAADLRRIVTGGQPIPDNDNVNVLVAVNLEYTHPGTCVHAGDQVAFFPPSHRRRSDGRAEPRPARGSRQDQPRCLLGRSNAPAALKLVPAEQGGRRDPSAARRMKAEIALVDNARALEQAARHIPRTLAPPRWGHSWS